MALFQTRRVSLASSFKFSLFIDYIMHCFYFYIYQSGVHPGFCEVDTTFIKMNGYI